MKNKITRIEIYSKITDTRAEVIKNKLLNQKLISSQNALKIADVYTTDKSFTSGQITKIAQMLANPVCQSFVVTTNNKPVVAIKTPFCYAIEIGFLPGVTDNIGSTAKESIEDLLKNKFRDSQGIYFTQLYLIYGKISKEAVSQIAGGLHNPLIQRSLIKDYKNYQKDKGMGFEVPKVKLKDHPEITKVDLNVADDELIKIGKSGIENKDGSRRGPLALDLEFMKTIQSYFRKIGRDPNDIELESIAQTWSEHCKHTIFADPMDELKDGLFKTYIKKATEEIRDKKGKKDFCISVFTDNSGAIAFDEKYLVTHKAETHNSPSALDPFGGAITGIVGVNRDTIGFGMGAKPVANFYGFCFADPEKDIPLYKGKNKTQKMLSSRRIMDGVIAGVNSGGNQSGIPTPQGFIYFNPRYVGKPLVFVGTVGLAPRKIGRKLSHLKKAEPGDLIVMTGGRVGKDGIHGATFSSEALDSGSPATAVQLGDPITQKKLSDAIVKEARDLQLYNSITDNGAGGLSCSVAEMAKESNGCIVDLEKVPLKYPNLEPWEIWISESQERMTLAVSPTKWKKFNDLMQKRGVEATIIGKFTGSGNCVVNFKNQKIMDIDLEFLHDGLPARPMHTKMPASLPSKKAELIYPKPKASLEKLFLKLLSRLNITSYEFISRQYDHIVQGSAVLGPLQGRGRVNGDTSVFRPLLSSRKGVILSQALYPEYSEINPYDMAASSIDTAIRNAVAAGANPDYLALLDNFCWPSGSDPERQWQLKESARACYDYALAYQTPFISGKDSMFNDFKGFDEDGNPVKISVPPTLLISSFGVIDDISKVVSLDSKIPGDLIYLLGETLDELGGSEYLTMQNNSGSGHNIPRVSAEKNKKIYKAVFSAIQKNLIASSVSVRHGGLATALAKKAIGGKLGISIDLKKIPGTIKSDEVALFSETQGRILVTVNPKNQQIFESVVKGTPFMQIGEINKETEITIKGFGGNKIIDIDLQQAIEAYRKTFKNY